MFPWLYFGQVRASASSRTAALEGPTVEALTKMEDGATAITAGAQTKGALPVKTELFEAAVYSSRGRGYARYNEDGALLFRDGSARLYASVYDQAGGLGGRVRGAASAVAARHMFAAYQRIAVSKSRTPDYQTMLLDAIGGAHEELVKRGEGEVTTAVSAVLAKEGAVLINSGDSGALLFDAKGQLKVATEMHEHDSPLAYGCLTHAVGLTPEGPAAASYGMDLVKGDVLLMCTDGLLDAGLSLEEVGKTLVTEATTEDAVNKIATRVLRLMSTLRAKPDNLTLIAIRVL